MEKTGKIYKIVNEDTGDIYIGSTTQTLLKRLAGHKSDTKRLKLCCCSNWFKNNNKVSIHLIEEIKFNTVEEVRKRERFHIENNECININIPTRTKNEYRQTDICRLKENLGATEYRKKNKEEIYNKVKIKISCDICKKLITKYNMKRHLKIHST